MKGFATLGGWMVVNADWIKKIPIFSGLPGPAADALAGTMHRKRIPARYILFHQGDPVTVLYCLARGRIRMSLIFDDGQESTINILGDGEFFPHTGLLGGGVYPATAISMVETEVAVVLRDDLEALVKQEPTIAYHLLLEMGRRVENLQERVCDLAQRDLRMRVLCALMRFVTMSRARIPRSQQQEVVDLNFNLTHEELARLAGGARESISRILSELRRKGVIFQSSHGRLGIKVSRLEDILKNCRAHGCSPIRAGPHSCRLSLAGGRDVVRDDPA